MDYERDISCDINYSQDARIIGDMQRIQQQILEHKVFSVGPTRLIYRGFWIQIQLFPPTSDNKCCFGGRSSKIYALITTTLFHLIGFES